VPRSGRGEEGCAAKVLLALGVDGCVLPGAGKQGPSSTGAAPGAAEAKGNVAQRLREEGKPASSQESHAQVARMG